VLHSVSKPMRERMRRLEQLDAQDRVDGTARMERLRQIPPQTGRFLAIWNSGIVTNSRWARSCSL
jgi:hypothetical protein